MKSDQMLDKVKKYQETLPSKNKLLIIVGWSK